MGWVKEFFNFIGDMYRNWVGKMTATLSVVLGIAPIVFPSFFVGDKGLLRTQWCWWLASALSFVVAARMAWGEQRMQRLKAESQLADICAQPPEIKLAIEDVVMHRTGDNEWRWKNGEFLVQVSAELLNLPSSTVEYSAQLVFRGEVIELSTIRDVDKWEIVERKYYQQPYPSMSRPREYFVTNPAAITDNLFRSIRNEGWLHFQIEGMGETEIAKRNLRLYAQSKNGGCYCDEELAKHHVVRSDLVAMRKYISTQP